MSRHVGVLWASFLDYNKQAGKMPPACVNAVYAVYFLCWLMCVCVCLDMCGGFNFHLKALVMCPTCTCWHTWFCYIMAFVAPTENNFQSGLEI